MKKLHDYLNRIDFFVTLLQAIWSFLGACAVFVGYEYLVVPVPGIAVFMGTCLWIAVGIFLQKRLKENPRDKTFLAAYSGFHYGLPLLACLLRLFFLDDWYSFEEILFGGLGLFIETFLIGGIVLIGCLVFWIVWFVRRRREKKGKAGASSFWRKVGYALNVLCFWGIAAAAAIGLIGYGTEALYEELQDREERRNQAYLQERYEALCAVSGDMSEDEAAWQLMADGYLCAFVTELLAKESAELPEESFTGESSTGGSFKEEPSTGEFFIGESSTGGSFIGESSAGGAFIGESSTGGSFMEESPMEDFFMGESFIEGSYGKVPSVEEYSMEELAADLNELLCVSQVTAEVLEQGIENYREFMERYEPYRTVDNINQEIAGNFREKTVSVSVELFVRDTRTDTLLDVYIITTFDEAWNVVRVECRRERLSDRMDRRNRKDLRTLIFS